MGFECEMCESKIKTSQPIYIMTDTLFLPNGRWSEHLITDNYCSLKCMRENLEGSKGEGIQDGEGPECSVCNAKFSAGHTATVGWCKSAVYVMRNFPQDTLPPWAGVKLNEKSGIAPLPPETTVPTIVCKKILPMLNLLWLWKFLRNPTTKKPAKKRKTTKRKTASKKKS